MFTWKKKASFQNNPGKSYTEKKAKHTPLGYSLERKKEKNRKKERNERKYYR